PDASFLINVRYEPDPPTVGEGIVVVILRDSGGFPIDNATLFLRGDMTHAGMAPVETEFSDSVDGEYRVPFNWNMGGDWILTVRAVLADGTASEVQFNVSVGS
ncbi:MAG: FixH family protein, partial [Anaerolineae bacterium]